MNRWPGTAGQFGFSSYHDHHYAGDYPLGEKDVQVIDNISAVLNLR